MNGKKQAGSLFFYIYFFTNKKTTYPIEAVNKTIEPARITGSEEGKRSARKLSAMPASKNEDMNFMIVKYKLFILSSSVFGLFYHITAL